MVWPPKPRGLAKGSGAQFYNIDFSLQTQLSKAGAQNAAALAAAAHQTQGKQVSVTGGNELMCVYVEGDVSNKREEVM